MSCGGLKAIAFVVALLPCGCATSHASEPITDYQLLVEACFESAPTFASAEGAALRAGRRPPEQLAWTNATRLESVRVVAAWDVSATGLPDKVAPIAILEGQFDGQRARSCIGGQSVHARPALEDRLSARFDLQLLRREAIFPIGFVRTTYSANLNGADTVVVIEGAGGGGFPFVEVIVVGY
jgi:hypothetical protein